MLSIEKCKKILNKKEKKYTDEQIKKLRNFLYILAEIDYNNFKENLIYEQKSNNLHKGFN